MDGLLNLNLKFSDLVSLDFSKSINLKFNDALIKTFRGRFRAN